MNLTVKRLHSKKPDTDIPKTPEKRLELVELLRIQAGKFLYDYPARFRRVVRVVRAK
jgi:hypothetical protein